MATLYITEYVALARDGAGYVAPVAMEPPIAEQTVAIGVGSVQSSAFSATTALVRVHADAICSVAIGSNPTAAATSRRMAAGQTEYFGVSAGRALKIAVITNT